MRQVPFKRRPNDRANGHRWEVGPYAVTLWGRRVSFELIMGYKRAGHMPGICEWSNRTAPTGDDAIARPVYPSGGFHSTYWKGIKQLCPGCGRAMSVSSGGFFTQHKSSVVGQDLNSAESWGLEPGGRYRPNPALLPERRFQHTAKRCFGEDCDCGADR